MRGRGGDPPWRNSGKDSRETEGVGGAPVFVQTVSSLPTHQFVATVPRLRVETVEVRDTGFGSTVI